MTPTTANKSDVTMPISFGNDGNQWVMSGVLNWNGEPPELQGGVHMFCQSKGCWPGLIGTGVDAGGGPYFTTGTAIPYNGGICESSGLKALTVAAFASDVNVVMTAREEMIERLTTPLLKSPLILTTHDIYNNYVIKINKPIARLLLCNRPLFKVYFFF